MFQVIRIMVSSLLPYRGARYTMICRTISNLLFCTFLTFDELYLIAVKCIL